MKTPRMRTIPQSAEELKALDQNTSLTECAIRRLVDQGKIKCVKAGRKKLINLDQLINYLSDPFAEDAPEEALAKKEKVISLERMEAYKKNIGIL
ncbi:DNA-binding protein [Acetobacterium wieringae]|uniref:DNA-binding protein n=1 Tax=Acetobacterium wieringae TaxID=52694 RepID=UPI0026EB1618|nr:DNA-binding protein [Acetobacterium wieringae]